MSNQAEMTFVCKIEWRIDKTIFLYYDASKKMLFSTIWRSRHLHQNTFFILNTRSKWAASFIYNMNRKLTSHMLKHICNHCTPSALLLFFPPPCFISDIRRVPSEYPFEDDSSYLKHRRRKIRYNDREYVNKIHKHSKHSMELVNHHTSIEARRLYNVSTIHL